MVNSCQSDSALTRICKASLRRKCGLQRACREQAALWSEAVRGSKLLALAGWAAWQGGVPRKPRCGVLMVTRDLSTASQMMSQHVGGRVIPTQGWKAGGALGQVLMAPFWPCSSRHTHLFILEGPPWAMDHQPGSWKIPVHSLLVYLWALKRLPDSTPMRQLCFDMSRTRHNLNSSFLVPREVERKYLSIGLGADAGSGKLSNLPRTQHPGM